MVPYHRIPRANIHEDLLAIEREGERVVSAHPDTEVFHVFTEYVRAVETRLSPMTHAARVGAQQQRAEWDGAR